MNEKTGKEVTSDMMPLTQDNLQQICILLNKFDDKTVPYDAEYIFITARWPKDLRWGDFEECFKSECAEKIKKALQEFIVLPGFPGQVRITSLCKVEGGEAKEMEGIEYLPKGDNIEEALPFLFNAIIKQTILCPKKSIRMDIRITKKSKDIKKTFIISVV